MSLSRRLILFLSFIIGQSLQAQTPAPQFQGLYVGAAVGSQNIFGGAFIDGWDVLAQKSGFVLDMSVGYRQQFWQNRLVLGAEFSYGITDGDLKTEDPRYLFPIQYTNKNQLGIGLQLGLTIGAQRQGLIYIYGQQARRRFDIDFVIADGSQYEQEDIQNFERLGLGFEYPVSPLLHLRASIARIFVDYGDLITTIDIEDKMDFNIGVLFNLKKQNK